MDESIKIRLARLKKKIENEDYNLKSVREWGGADVIIRNKLTPDVESWVGNEPFVISFQNNEPRRRAVITTYSKELSWLFYQLRDIFSVEIDYISKYDFYGMLAQSAMDFIEENNSFECKELLLKVLKTVYGDKR